MCLELIKSILITQTGIPNLVYKEVLMILIAFFFLYLAVGKGYEPLLLVPIGFGIFLVNFPLVPLMGFTENGTPELIRAFYKYGVEWEIIPCVIFLGLGAMTDFGPLIANPKTLIIGAGAQLGVFITYIGGPIFRVYLERGCLGGHHRRRGRAYHHLPDRQTGAASAGRKRPGRLFLHGHGAAHSTAHHAADDHPEATADPHAPVTPPFRPAKKLLFPLIGSILIILLIPAVAPLMGMFMFGNFMRECLVVNRLSDTAQNALMNIVTIFLGLSVGATMQAEVFLNVKPLLIFSFGLLDFIVCTFGGILTVHIMNRFLKEKINPLIGSAGVSAVPMAARVAHAEGLKYDPDNWLLMHAMGPNLAGVIGSAAAAGMFIAMFQ